MATCACTARDAMITAWQGTVGGWVNRAELISWESGRARWKNRPSVAGGEEPGRSPLGGGEQSPAAPPGQSVGQGRKAGHQGNKASTVRGPRRGRGGAELPGREKVRSSTELRSR